MSPPNAVWEPASVPQRMEPETYSTYSDESMFTNNNKNKAVAGLKNALSGR